MNNIWVVTVVGGAIAAVIAGIILLIIQRRTHLRRAVSTHDELAERHLKAGQYRQAVQEATEAIREYIPASTWRARAESYLRLREYDKAIEDATEALKIEESASLYEIIAEAYRRKGSYDQAIKSATAALKLKPNSAYALRIKADSYLYSGNPMAAIQNATASLRIEINYFGLETRAEAYLRLHQYNEAIGDAQKALKYKPESSYAQRVLTQAKTERTNLIKSVIYKFLIGLGSIVILFMIVVLISSTSSSSNLRSNPKKLSVVTVNEILKSKGFYDFNRNPLGRGWENQYHLFSSDNQSVVIDEENELTWQQSGSSNKMSYQDAQKYTDGLNRLNYLGFNDWRMPTLEEAMSLMETQRRLGLNIDPIFDSKQHTIWTSDMHNETVNWIVNFRNADCLPDKKTGSRYVRAVRSGNIKS